MKRQVSKMMTDEEAEAFLDEDLSDLDFRQFKPVKFQKIQNEIGVRAASIKFKAGPYLASGAALRPGTPTPRSGIYEQRGPRGGHTGIEADSTRQSTAPRPKRAHMDARSPRASQSRQKISL